MRRDFHFPNALHSVCVCVFIKNFFYNASRTRVAGRNTSRRFFGPPCPFFFCFLFRSKDEKEQSSAVTTCAQAGSNNAAGSQLATRRFRESKGRGKGRKGRHLSLQILRSQSRRTEGLGLGSTTDPARAAEHRPSRRYVAQSSLQRTSVCACLTDAAAVAPLPLGLRAPKSWLHTDHAASQ